MTLKRFYNIDELSIILGKNVSSIHGHLYRKQFDAVPPPLKLGRRLAWAVESVDVWIKAKVEEAERQVEESQSQVAQGCLSRKRGRPTKVETIHRKNQ